MTERKRALLQTSDRERELYGRAETGRERREERERDCRAVTRRECYAAAK